MSNCCARCKTPYNCGNPSCACHVKANPKAAMAWNATNQEPAPAERFVRPTWDHRPDEDQ